MAEECCPAFEVPARSLYDYLYRKSRDPMASSGVEETPYDVIWHERVLGTQLGADIMNNTELGKKWKFYTERIEGSCTKNGPVIHTERGFDNS